MDKLEEYLNNLNAIDGELAELNGSRYMLPMYAFVELRRRQLLKRRTATAKDYYFAFAKQSPRSLWVIDSFEKTAPFFFVSDTLNSTDAVKKLCKLHGLECNEHGIHKMEKYGYCNAYTHVDQLGNKKIIEMATPLGQIRLLTNEKTALQIAKSAQLNYNQRDDSCER